MVGSWSKQRTLPREKQPTPRNKFLKSNLTGRLKTFANLQTSSDIVRPHPVPLPRERVIRRPFIARWRLRFQIAAQGDHFDRAEQFHRI